MEVKENLFEPLIETLQEYSKASYELVKLKAIDKTADLGSTFITHSLLTIILSMFLLVFNIGISLWLGDILGKSYYGFIIVGIFYLIIGIMLMFMKRRIKVCLFNSILKEALN